MQREKVQYGVFLNIHPSSYDKRVMIHKLDCPHYKQLLKKGKAKGIYTFHKDCLTFDEVIKRVSEWALDWHAPIKICKSCRKNWKLI